MNKVMRKLIHFTLAVAVIALGVVGFGALKGSKPEIPRERVEPSAPLVRTMTIMTGSAPVWVGGEGTVRPVKEIQLIPQVGGKVVYLSPNLVNGGAFSKDEVLLRIDPVDYELSVTLAKARVMDAESRLQLAEEEAAAGKEEWRLLYPKEKEGSGPPPLVAKEPQLAAARARLEADRADLRKAILNLERTELSAPFEGRVGQETVDVGQHVNQGQPLANLFSTEAAEIVVPLENKSLAWLRVPGFTTDEGKGSPAKVRARIAGQQTTWEGRVVRTEGKLDERTRMVNVVLRVERPYDRRPPLALGLFVTVDIEGVTLEGAAIVPRAALREGNLVWVVDGESRLNFRPVDVARIQGEKVLIRHGLRDGEVVVLSPLKAVSDKMAVRVVKEAEDERS
jgi:RND family efflux transporter MFP subunit